MTDKNTVVEAGDMIGGKSDSGKTTETGNTHANRIADKGDNKEAMPTIDPKDGPSSKAQIISYTSSYIAGLSNENALSFFDSIKSAIHAKDATYTGGNTKSTTAMASIATKEDLALVFAADETLSEEFKEKASTIFEAAITAAIVAETAKLEESFETKLETVSEEVKKELTERVGNFIDYIAEKWVEENKLAVTTSIRTEAVDSFLTGLKGLFAEHYVDIPEDKVNVVESLTAQNEALETQINEETAKSVALAKELRSLKAATMLESKLEGLTDTQKDKFRSLASAFEGSFAEGMSLEDYEGKLTTIAESVAVKAAPVLQEDVTIDPVETTATQPVLDPQMAMFVKALERTAR